jgi:hypothetical protein
MEIETLNTQIKEQICYDTINKLKDSSLLEVYKKCRSVKKQISILEQILDKNEIPADKKDSIINDYILNLIPAGTKGDRRGNEFNRIVQEYIYGIQLDPERFDICFEKMYEHCLTDEIPDWYICEKPTGKVLIGMNQMDLWRGGHQLNRGSKYLLSDKYNTETIRLVCVICNDIHFKSKNNKAYTLFNAGFSNNTLSYLKNLKNIIHTFFRI